MAVSTVLFFILGIVAIIGGVTFVVARNRLSALAIRRDAGGYRNPSVLSPTMMLIGGIVLALVGICAIFAALFPTG